jgi:hypothetical protein
LTADRHDENRPPGKTPRRAFRFRATRPASFNIITRPWRQPRVPALRIPRQEKFVQALVAGMTAEAAYRSAGYRPNRSGPPRLKAEAEVRARIAELLAQGAAAAMLTRADILRKLLANADAAYDARQYSAATGALKLLGQELGMFVDRRINVNRSLNDMTEEELRTVLGMTAAEIETILAARGRGGA